MSRVLGAVSALRDEMAVWVRLMLVACVASAAHRWPGLVASVGLVVFLAFWPATIVIPKFWREEVSSERSDTLMKGFLAATPLVFVGSYGQLPDDDFQTTVVILGIAILLLWGVARFTHLKRQSVTVTVWLCALFWAAAGLVSEFPGPRPMTVLVFGVYGAAAAIFGTAVFLEEGE